MKFRKSEFKDKDHTSRENMKEIYLAGGCFWGTQKYFAQVQGILETEVGYANGNTTQPSYEDVCHRNSGHSEAVKIVYNPQKVSLSFILQLFYDVIDPLAKNRQGNDIGVQYRTGIYYTDRADKDIIEDSLQELQKLYDKPIAIEALPLENYAPAEDYHQDYLDKNPGGYCHIGPDKFEKAKSAQDPKLKYQPKSQDALKESLTKLQYEVTQNNATEPPFKNEYNANFEEGIYVDITTGEPLFVSTDKFEAGCGWPSFSKPIDSDLINELEDKIMGMRRIEVRSKKGDAHLGHVFTDGPSASGGLRYCINSASLQFIAKEEMKEKGYGDLLHLLN